MCFSVRIRSINEQWQNYTKIWTIELDGKKSNIYDKRGTTTTYVLCQADLASYLLGFVFLA